MCHYAILVGGNPSPQYIKSIEVINRADSELSDLFSERIDEGGDYYYDEGDDPYGFLNDDENSNIDESDYTDPNYYEDYEDPASSKIG